jgi:hypothetical protein
VTGKGGIAAGADTAVLQVNAQNASAGGYLDAYAAGSSDPNVSALAYSTDTDYRDLLYVPLSGSGAITLANHGSAPVSVTLWGRGYYMPPATSPAGATFASDSPQIVYGTSNGGTALGPGASATFQVTGATEMDDIPSAGVSAVAEDVVASNPTAMGNVAEGPAGGSTRPIVSFLNADVAYTGYDDGIVSTLSPSGQETITNNSTGTVDVQVAVTGWFQAPVAPGEPADVAASINGSTATVTWLPPSADGGSPITGYTVTAQPGNISVNVAAGAGQATLSGLPSPSSEVFTVAASNSVGTGKSQTTAPQLMAAGGQYFTTPPVKALDTTDGTGGVAAGPLAAGGTAVFPVTGVGQVPAAGVSDVYVAISASSTQNTGCVTDSDPDLPDPAICAVDFAAGASATSTDVVQVSGSGTIAIGNNSPGTANFSVWVLGYFQDSDVTVNGDLAGDLYNGLPQASIVNTATGLGAPKSQVPAGSGLTIQVGGTGGVPAGAAGAVLLVRALNATSAGTISASPGGSPQAGNAVLSYPAGASSTGLYIGALNAAGQLTLANNGSSPVDMTVTVLGYLADPGSKTPGLGLCRCLAGTNRRHEVRNRRRPSDTGAARGVDHLRRLRRGRHPLQRRGVRARASRRHRPGSRRLPVGTPRGVRGSQSAGSQLQRRRQPR